MIANRLSSKQQWMLNRHLIAEFPRHIWLTMELPVWCWQYRLIHGEDE